MQYEELDLNINTDVHHLELEVERSTAFIDYKLSDHLLFLIHTEVPQELEGKGVGKAIVEKALQYAKRNDFKIIPLCSFVQAYLKRHKEWDYLVAPEADRFINKH